MTKNLSFRMGTSGKKCKNNEYDCLHNKYSQEFRDRNKKDNAWKEVASRFEDLNPSEATKRLKNIRSSHTRSLKERKRHCLAQGECCPQAV